MILLRIEGWRDGATSRCSLRAQCTFPPLPFAPLTFPPPHTLCVLLAWVASLLTATAVMSVGFWVYSLSPENTIQPVQRVGNDVFDVKVVDV